MAERAFNPFELLPRLTRRWRLPVKVCAVAGLAAAAVNFLLLPKWYEATTVIMPPQEKSAFSGLGMLLSRMPDLPGGLSRIASGITSVNASQFLFVVILNSRTVADSLIDKYDLERVYKSKYQFQARNDLKTHTFIDFPPEGHVIVKVEARENPQLARDLANEYVTQMNNVLTDRGIYTATRKRRFLESRLVEVRQDLTFSEDSLRAFQEKYKIIEPEEQARGLVDLITEPVKGTLEMLGMLQADRESKNIQLRIKESVYTAQHPEVYLLKREIAELDRTIGKIKNELTSSSSLDDNALRLQISEVPGIALEYARLLRTVKIQEQLFMLLSAQFEEARINEADDTPTAIVLDPAVTPEYKSRPQRLTNILVTAGAALILCILYLLIDERRRASAH